MSEDRTARAEPSAAPLDRLRRMRALATGLLVLMALVCGAAALAERRWPAAGYVRAFAEAALVGGCADWFAVTALFRRPLGLPIPHTAVIPRSKDRIGAALGRFIVDNFLDPQVLDARLREWEIGRWGGAWLAAPANARRLSDWAVRRLPELARSLPAEALEDLLASSLMGAARAVPAAPTASALLAAVWDEDRVQPLVERGAELLGGYLDTHQEVILEKVQAQSWRWLPSFVDKAVARRITAGLVQLLADVRQPDHPWRERLGAAVAQLIERLAHDPELREQGERLKLHLLADPRFTAYAARLREEVKDQLQSGRFAGDLEGVRARVEALVLALGAWLQGDAEVQRALNTLARALARRIVAPQRHTVARYVERIVQGWEAAGVVERLERQVGPDLQFIRISGTLVGGAVGLGLFALGRLLAGAL